MSEIRLMPIRTVKAARMHRCTFCECTISVGEKHGVQNAFDPDRTRDYFSNKWGAWLSARWHLCCYTGKGSAHEA